MTGENQFVLMVSEWNNEVTLVDDAGDIWAYTDLFKQALLGLGFHPDTVARVIVAEENPVLEELKKHRDTWKDWDAE